MAQLFSEAASGAGISDLARRMDELSPRAHGGLWTTSSINHMLRNRVYLGEVNYSTEQPLRNSRAHEALVDPQTWQAAQRDRRPRKKRGTPYVLSGLVRCAACRYVMSGGAGGAKGQLRVYRCQGRHGAGKCPEPTMIVAEALETWVLDHVQDLLGKTAVLAEPTDASGQLEHLAADVRRAEEELDAFMLDLSGRDRYGDRYGRYLEVRLRALEDAEAAYRAAAASRGPASLPAAVHWEDLTADELNSIATAAIDAVFLRRPPRHGAGVSERACILWRGEAEDDLPGKGRRSIALRPFNWPSEP